MNGYAAERADELIERTLEDLLENDSLCRELKLISYGKLREKKEELNSIAILEMDRYKLTAFLYPGNTTVRIKLFAGVQLPKHVISDAVEHICRIENEIRNNMEPVDLKIDKDGFLYADDTLHLDNDITAEYDNSLKKRLFEMSLFIDCFLKDFKNLADDTAPNLPPRVQVVYYLSSCSDKRFLSSLFGVERDEFLGNATEEECTLLLNSLFDEEGEITVLDDGTEALTPPKASCIYPDNFFDDYESGLNILHEEDEISCLPSDKEIGEYLEGSESVYSLPSDDEIAEYLEGNENVISLPSDDEILEYLGA